VARGRFGRRALLVYLVKYLFLLFTGWVFNSQEATGSYVFVVFLVNKVMGVLLIPFLLIFAFAVRNWLKYRSLYPSDWFFYCSVTAIGFLSWPSAVN
jgi:hypothetical protein